MPIDGIDSWSGKNELSADQIHIYQQKHDKGILWWTDKQMTKKLDFKKPNKVIALTQWWVCRQVERERTLPSCSCPKWSLSCASEPFPRYCNFAFSYCTVNHYSLAVSRFILILYSLWSSTSSVLYNVITTRRCTYSIGWCLNVDTTSETFMCLCSPYVHISIALYESNASLF